MKNWFFLQVQQYASSIWQCLLQWLCGRNFLARSGWLILLWLQYLALQYWDDPMHKFKCFYYKLMFLHLAFSTVAFFRRLDELLTREFSLVPHVSSLLEKSHSQKCKKNKHKAVVLRANYCTLYKFHLYVLNTCFLTNS